MKKITIFAILLLIFSPLNARAAEMSVVTNNISGGTTQQYYIFSCAGMDCEKIMEKFMQLKITNDAAEVMPAQTAEPPATPSVIPAPVAAVVPIITNELPAQENNENDIVNKVFAPQSVRISEIVAVPGPNDNEWVELFNATDEPIDLARWKLVEGGGKQTELSGIIPPGEYLVFDKSSLNNDGDQIILKDAENNIMDEVRYGSWANSIAPASKQGDSLILSDDKYFETTAITKGSANILTAPIISATQTPVVSEMTNSETVIVQPQLPLTATETVVTVEPPQTVLVVESLVPSSQSQAPAVEHISKVFISEFLPNPKDGEEWIELYNDGESAEDLFGYSIDDSPGGSAPYKIKDHVIIPAKNFLQLKATETKLALNNDGDQVALRDANGSLLSFTEYKQSKSGVSFAFFEDGWQETNVLTPGAPNIKQPIQVAVAVKSTTKKVSASSKSRASSANYYQEISLEDSKSLPLKTKVKLRGQVIVLPKTFSEKYMYIDGLQIYFSKADWPAFELGDELEIAGAISESSGERRLVVKEKNDIVVIEQKEPLIPGEINALDLSDEDVGTLVSLRGKLLEKKGSKLVFGDADGEFFVQLNTKTTAKSADYNLGSSLKISGVLKKYSDGYRLVPREKEDLSFIQEESPVVSSSINLEPDHAGRNVVLGLICLATLFLCVNLYFLWQKRDEFNKYFSPAKQLISRLSHRNG